MKLSPGHKGGADPFQFPHWGRPKRAANCLKKKKKKKREKGKGHNAPVLRPPCPSKLSFMKKKKIQPRRHFVTEPVGRTRSMRQKKKNAAIFEAKMSRANSREKKKKGKKKGEAPLPETSMANRSPAGFGSPRAFPGKKRRKKGAHAFPSIDQWGRAEHRNKKGKKRRGRGGRGAPNSSTFQFSAQHGKKKKGGEKGELRRIGGHPFLISPSKGGGGEGK